MLVDPFRHPFRGPFPGMTSGRGVPLPEKNPRQWWFGRTWEGPGRASGRPPFPPSPGFYPREGKGAGTFLSRGQALDLMVKATANFEGFSKRREAEAWELIWS